MSGNGIIQVLSDSIDVWLRHSSHSLLNLARKTGVSYPQLRRIYNKESKSTSSDKANSILEITESDPDVRRTILNEHYRGVGDILAPLNADVNEILSDFIDEYLRYKVFAVCDTVLGARESEIRRRFGEEGSKALDFLIATKVVNRVDDDTVKTDGNPWCPESSKVTIKMMIHALNSLNSESFDNNLASSFFFSEGVNEQGLKKLQDAEMEMIGKVKAVVNDPSCFGRIPAFVLSSVGSFYSSVDKN